MVFVTKNTVWSDVDFMTDSMWRANWAELQKGVNFLALLTLFFVEGFSKSITANLGVAL